MSKYIEIERNGVKFKIKQPRQKFDNPLRYFVNKYEFKGLIHIAFFDRWDHFDPRHKSIIRFMERCGFEFVEQGQVWELHYCPENWEMFVNGEFDDCLQAFWKNPRRHSGWDYIEFLI